MAYKLGFEYPANFSKFFKARTGLSPNQFRK
ncbi:helix-turn-helix domain-containing protein [Paenibacillus hunanensis]|nr:helix-turn-helix domain-containing protein [Paenibacillus hunanensis]